jgi:transposase-like zinc ribbon protein
MNLLKVTKTFTTEDAAPDYLIKQRWPKGVRCLACDHDKVYTIATKGKTGKPRTRRRSPHRASVVDLSVFSGLDLLRNDFRTVCTAPVQA